MEVYPVVVNNAAKPNVLLLDIFVMEFNYMPERSSRGHEVDVIDHH